MSPSSRPALSVRRAPHAESAFQADIDACSEVIALGDLQYIAHFTSGVFDFATEAGDSLERGPAAEEARYRTGRQLSLSVTELDMCCQPLDSGPLIRVVVEGDTGALFHYVKLAGQVFFGMTQEGSGAIRRADQQIADLATKAARRLGAAPMNWGGFGRWERSDEFGAAYEPAPAQAPPSPRVFAGRRSVPNAVTQACEAALSSADIHYVGIYRMGEPEWYADILEAPELSSFFQRVTPQRRRAGYAELIRQVYLHSRGLTHLLEIVHSTRLSTLVLDVARGAIYVMPVGRDDYLVAVTLAQSQVERAHIRLRALFEQVSQLGAAGG
jgi:hypothetical protein